MAARFFSSGHPSLKWRCSKCRGQEAEEHDEKRASRNCDGETSQNLAFDFQPSLRRCPWSQIDHETMQAVKWFTDWRDYKILPFGGTSLLDEPAYVDDVIHPPRGVIKEIDAEAAKRQRAEMDKAMKRGRSRG